MKKLLSAIVFATCGFAVTATAQAHFEAPEDAIEYRQAAFKLVGDVFGGRLGPVARGDVDFDEETVEANAELLKVLIDLPWVGFGEGTQGGDSEDSIWTNKDDFDEKARASVVAVAELEEAAESGDLNKFKAAFANVGQSCKTCHDSYRK
ncbi:MAG: cytochrome c [Alcaligenaceae bacterium]|jgi:cytochrome c556|nr:cytochrome c [Alcaligenaceae bacterium]